MRNSSFSQVVDDVRIEARLSTNPSRGLDNREYIEAIVNRVYEMLWDDYEWEHLTVKRDEAFIQLQAGLNVYNFPDMIDLMTVTKVWATNGDIWLPVESGIEFTDYSAIDPTKNERSDPVERWEARSMNTFEVYPLPASNNERIGFEARRKFKRLVKQSDIVLLDPMAITLMCASELLANSGAKDAPIKLKMAQDRLNKFKARTSSDKKFGFSGCGDNKPYQSKQLRVAYVRN